MPCSKPVRGKTDTEYPWSDAIDNDPCGKPVVSTSSPLATDQSAHNLCLPHLKLKLGQANPTLSPPYTFAP